MALSIGLTTALKPIWRKAEAYERLMAEKRHDPSKAPDPRKALADYLTGKFAQARWDVTHAEPGNGA